MTSPRRRLRLIRSRLHASSFRRMTELACWVSPLSTVIGHGWRNLLRCSSAGWSCHVRSWQEARVNQCDAQSICCTLLRSGRSLRPNLPTSPLSQSPASQNSPSTTPSSRCRSGSAATRQRSAECSTSSTVSSPTNARSVLARLTRRPGETSFSGQGSPSAPSQPRMRLRMPSREFRSCRGVSSLMGSTTVYEEKVSDSFMASASVAVLNSATVKRWRTMRGCNRDEIAP